MAVLGQSLYGQTVLGVNEFYGKLGGVMTITDIEPIWMTRHEGVSHIGVDRSSPSNPIAITREEPSTPIVLIRMDGDSHDNYV